MSQRQGEEKTNKWHQMASGLASRDQRADRQNTEKSQVHNQ